MTSVLVGITIVFAAAWCAASLMSSASAASRHGVWTCAFAAVLLLAPLRSRLPHREITASPVILITTTPAAVAATADRTEAPPFDPLNAILILWAAGTAVMTLRLLGSALQLRSIVRRASGERPVLISTVVQGPLVTGVFQPVILLPETSSGWTLARRRAVLAHEAAHIRRHDPAILLAAHIARAIYWFHPLCWLAMGRLRAESERACDDAALRIGLKPSGYAGHLLDLARKFNTQLAIPMATTFHLESRVKAILDPAVNRSFPARTFWCAAVVVTAVLLAPLSTITLRAQQSAAGTGVISGTVLDPTGARVPRANLTASNSDVTYEVSTVADSVGVYSFTGLPPGHYTVEASVPGFAKFHAANLALVSGGRMQVDANLAVGKITMAVQIAAQSPAKPQATAAAASAKPIRVGGNVEAAKLLRQIKPVYPADLQAQGIEATVVLQAVISKEGIPMSLKVVNTGVNQEFVDAAMAAFAQWRFQPTKLNGEPIEILASSQFDFKLNGQAAVIDDRVK